MTARTLYSWFQEAVDRYPDHTAIEVQDASYTYRELHDQAEALAELLVREHGRVPERIALLAMRSHVAYAGYLAALRLGAVVTPLNARFPVTRNQATCDLARIDVVIADEAGAAQLARPEGWEGHQAIALTAADVAEGKAGGSLPAYRGDLEDVAYLLFTSGSTGRPKGVPIRHRNASAYVAHSVERYDVRPGDRVSHTFDLTFDPSVFDLFVTWAAGATLVVPQRTELLTPVDYIIDRRITHWFSVPSVVSVSRSLGKLFTGVSDTLRYSLFIGEQLTLDQAAAWRQIAPGAVLGNVYGPTELTVACTGYELPADPEQWPATSNDTVPIGPVYPFLEWLVLGEDGRPAEDGELVVRGSQRFAGYYDPADDAGRFLSVEETPDGPVATVYDGTGELTDAHYYRTGDRVRLENGTWVHLGRLDNQVKIRGYRVELGEIETVLRRHPGVDQAVVVVSPQGPAAGVVAFFTGPGEPDLKELKSWLRKKLPVHMVPQQYTHLDALPLNASGKADRPALTRMLAERATQEGK
ncbi:amino acid adenylation domain-containing protein [Streptomyces sp. URMC 124]|uniref:amino acid adenylation domain-containing protein n=1 Tax=Streptomyces sp. URMC 124 TaxID=3423405 RepID=UPI003F1A574E